MLLTDDGWLTIADLRDEDPKLVGEIADAEGIKLETCISRALDNVQVKLLNDLVAFESFPSDGVNLAMYRALALTGGITRVVPQQIVVDTRDGQKVSALKTWALHEAIHSAYRKCLNNNYTDSYRSRVQFEDEEIRNKYYPRVYNMGVGCVRRPIYRPGATREWFDVGQWADNSVITVAGSGPGGSYDVVVTFVDQVAPGYTSWSNTGNAESAPSDIVTITAQANTDLQVDISCFAPPQGIIPTEHLGVISPRIATGWNIYCGPQGGTLRLQNATPFPIVAPPANLTQPYFSAIAAQKFTPIAGYANLGTGQRREVNVQPASRFMRV